MPISENSYIKKNVKKVTKTSKVSSEITLQNNNQSYLHCNSFQCCLILNTFDVIYSQTNLKRQNMLNKAVQKLKVTKYSPLFRYINTYIDTL
jgi:hypothetical protein